MKVNGKDIYEMENKSHVWNHQPDQNRFSQQKGVFTSPFSMRQMTQLFQPMAIEKIAPRNMGKPPYGWGPRAGESNWFLCQSSSNRQKSTFHVFL